MEVDYNESQNYQLNVGILEARHLAIANVDTKVVVSIGNQKKKLMAKTSQTDAPYYNEYCFFPFYLPLSVLLDKMLTISIYQTHMFWKKKLIGSCNVELSIVWSQPNHQFFHKWAVLYNPEDPTGAVKGFIKCDISILAKGFSTKPPDHDPGETIEDNLLVPADEINDRRRANFIFTIFRADGFSENTPSQPYVRLKFSGEIGKTSIKKSSQKPEWNEELIFFEMVPSLSQNICIEVCDNHLPESRKILGVAHLNLQDLSHEGENGFLPTYGPCFLYLYKDVQKFEKKDKFCSNSKTYACRVLLALRTEILDLDQEIPAKFKKVVKSNQVEPLVEDRYFKYEKFILFAAVFNILIFDKKFAEKSVEIKILMGPKNNIGVEDSKADGDKVDKNFKLKVRNDKNTTASLALTVKENFSYVNFNNLISCIHVEGVWPNSLRRTNRSTIIQEVIDDLSKGINEVEQELYFMKKIEASIKIKKILFELILNCQGILKQTQKIFPEDTNLHRERKRVYHEALRDIIKKAEEIKKKKIIAPEGEIKKLREYASTLLKFANDPENSFPDTEIWLLKKGKSLAHCTMPTEYITYSQDVKGLKSGEREVISLRGKDGVNVAQLDMFMWFGLVKDFEECYNLLPQGFKVKNWSDDNERIPSLVEYVEMHKFQCRVHVFQARITLSGRVSGLVDPFVRVVLLGDYQQTQVKKNTVDPIWDETLVFKEVVLHGTSREIKRRSQVVNIEILDREKSNKNDLIGRCFLYPLVKLNDENYEPPEFPPKLKWERLYINTQETGRILIATEFLEISETEPPEPPRKKKAILSIPNDIRPHFASHRLEILFWGIRDLKKEKFTPFTHKIIVSVECGKYKISSSISKKKSVNFSNSYKFLDLEIPEESEYAPPMTIKLYQRSDLKKSYVGSAFIPSILLYFCPLMDEKEIKDKEIEFAAMHWEAEKIKLTELKESQPKKKTMFKYKFFRCMENMIAFCRKLRKKQPKPLEIGKALEDENFDWWLKYHASKDKSEQSKIATFTVYEEELESQPEFNGFTDFLSIYNITSGKSTKKMKMDENVIGKFKAVFKFYKWPLEKENLKTLMGDNPDKGILTRYPKNDSIKVLVRVYIIQATNLMPKDVFGKSDPYLILTLGNKKINDRINYVANRVNVVFGKCFEFKAQFPEDYLLKITVMDHDIGAQDDIIGETCIDIENRYYSKHRASCGLSKHYEKSGYNAWRDMLLPSEILGIICKQSNCDEPIYKEKSVKIDSYEFAITIPEQEPNKKEKQALSVLHRWHEIPLRGFYLVPEHIETRSLYHPSIPGIEQGKIELWVDIFPEDYRYMPPVVDISPRKPTNMELRAIIWNVEDVILDDTSFLFRQKMSDIYIRGWISGLEHDIQKTDIHYRSLNGEGNFNWRFVFPITYILAEHKLVVKKAPSTFDSNPEEEKIPCKLELEVWDNDALFDDFLGSLSLELWAMPRGAKVASMCKLHLLKNEAPRINLFKIRRTRGWWPFRRLENKDSTDRRYALTGKIDLELEILTESEAKESPAGKGRNEPKALPFPHRPETSFFWFTSPLKAIRFIIWKQSMKFLIALLIITLIIMGIWFFLSGLYAFPGYFVKKILRA